MKRVILSLGMALILGFLITANASTFAASQNNPAGNNGVVKINNEVVPDNIPQNHPHVSCSFSVEFYNYDKNNNYADVNFELQAPTNKSGDSLKVETGNLHPFIGGDVAGGGNDLDARETYTLSFTGTPQQNQGYHVKLSVVAVGSKGSNAKHKVFWVEPCAQKSTTSPQVLSENQITSLPNTGPGNTLIGVFLGTSLIAGLAHYIWQSRRNVA